MLSGEGTPEYARLDALIRIGNTLTRVALLVDTVLEDLAGQSLSPEAAETLARLHHVGELLAATRGDLGRLID